jgi:predicted naringenin-chalcone synthase
MKIIVAAALLSISLCSCSAYNDRSVHRNLVGPTVVGDGNSVLVSHVRNQADGQQLADKHCQRFGKSAQFNRMEGVRAFFDCQSPS